MYKKHGNLLKLKQIIIFKKLLYHIMKYFLANVYFLFLGIFISNNSSAQLLTKKVSLEDIYKNYIFYPNTIENLRSTNDGLSYTTLEQGNTIERWNYESGKKSEVIFTPENTSLKYINDYEFSADEKKILISSAKERIYRYSFKVDYFIYNILTKTLQPLSSKGKQQLATFSPDGKKVAWVRDNNLFITDIERMNEIQVTSDGEKNKIINGATDWVYEEEFAFAKGFAWSPDSKKLAFYRFDETAVKEFDLTIYKDLYPDERRFKYPKAGEVNSVVSIKIYNVSTGTSTTMEIGDNPDQYIGRILWTSDPQKLAILRVNRLQNVLEVLHADASTGKSDVVFYEKNEKYINEPTDNTVTYLPDGQNFIIQSERNGWLHFYLYNFIKKEVKPVTSGDFDIIGFKGYDEKSHTLYYLSHERGVIHQDVYSINIDGSNNKRISTEDGWNDAEFSKGFKYYILDHSSSDVPDKYTLYNSNGKLIRKLEENEKVAEKMKEFNFVKHEFISVPVSNGLNLNAWIMKPADFNPSKKYPVFMYVYGGPQSQTATDAFSYFDTWFQMLTQKGYIVACVDGRGTDGRGEEFRKATYMQLGKYETEDQVSAARWLGNLPYIDSTRIGIFGWSYGAYMSLLCLFNASDIFKMAISVAPVTNWRYYDTVYTERFMRTPQENPAGYDDNSPINYVEKMKGKLLLVHGMADDNVHFQNSVELVQKLIEYNKQFDMQFYPNRNHGIYGGNATMHLYTKMTDFIQENL
jgi:dipeptidyl-peptidase 4